MKQFAIVLVILVCSCKKAPESNGARSNAAGSSTTAAGSSTAPAPDPDPKVSSFDDKLDLPKQPKRPDSEQAIVDKAADALRTALTKIKTAKDAKEGCALFKPLEEAMALARVNAPEGVDAAEFASKRTSFEQELTAADADCGDPQTDVDALQDRMDRVRKKFVELIQLGA